ncbi:MAG TPA: GGDEF domain-containing protein [Steroidobacteraceae bacterium]|nr:GGDEF domain-containing protein [Steroidobacteraceae bacterium]
MLGQLKSKLKASLNFPSPPAIAQQIIALARDPDTDISQIAATISRDPALAAKLLRVANSALYSQQRKSTNLRQALIVLGLQGATTLALGFSLVGAYKGLKSNAVDYDHYWRRAILSASAARCFGALHNASAADDIFLAALLQDIAILGIDRAEPDFYRELPGDASHRAFSEHEAGRLGTDHAELGAWLLEYWKLPGALCRAVAWSHEPPAAHRSTPTGMAACCVALGSECVEVLLAPPPAAADFAALTERAAQWLGIDAPAVAEVMGQIVAEIPEIERLFDTTLLKADAASVILAQARDLLILRNLQSLGQVSNLRATNLSLEARTAQLEDEQRRDRLTGLYNRGYLDLLLRREFQAAASGNWPLSVVYVALQRFEEINEAHGREAGDAVLLSTARTITAVARDTDYVARYGGTEFVIVLPGLASRGAGIFCERLTARLHGTSHAIGGTQRTVTASVGLATHAPEKPFERASHLINAAERCASRAGRSGRDRPGRHMSGRPVSAAKT